MLKRYYRLFLSAYEDTDYLTKARTRLLLTFLVAFIILVTLLQLSMLIVGLEAFLRVIRITPLFLIGLILSLFFLKKGRYSYASNIFLSVSTIVLMAGILSNAIIKPDIVYTTYIYFIYLAIAFCTLFCTSRFLTIITGALAITDVAAFFIVKLKIDPSLHSTVQLAFIDSLVTLILIYIVSLFTMNIAKKNITYATSETEKNIRKNIFINDTLRKSSRSVVDAAREMNSTFEAFSSNTRDQAAATEEITASMEEVLSGTEGIARNAMAQSNNIDELTDMANSLVAVMERLDSEIDATNVLTRSISEKALEGEKSLKLMDSSISNISNSSAEMLNIVNIINDISDRINLLSLNAAIEAARAGEAGRGFAVVADEISKLADQTATSIRDIDNLIKANDSYILEGTRNASGTITIINEIIHNISNITEMIFDITASMAEHKVLSESLNNKTAFINDRAVEIVGGTTEQKKATEEAANTITSINELSQANSSKIEEMISLSEKLVTMIDEMNKKIDTYENN